MTHPIGIRRLHQLFIGPCRPQKALCLSFSPHLPPSHSLASAQCRRGSKRKAVNKPVRSKRNIPEHGKDPAPPLLESHSGFSLNKLFPVHQLFTLVFFCPRFSAWISFSFCSPPPPSLSLCGFTFQFLALARLFLGRAG